MIGTWLTVTMATGRYMAVCHPFKARAQLHGRIPDSARTRSTLRLVYTWPNSPTLLLRADCTKQCREDTAKPAIDRYLQPPGAQQQTRRTLLLLSID